MVDSDHRAELTGFATEPEFHDCPHALLRYAA
jgi:hypothetical protein